MDIPIKYTLAFLRKGSEFLMLNRNAPPLMGMWNGVGGKVEPGETAVQAVIREITEETGLDVQVVEDKGICTWDVTESRKGGMHLFLADLDEGAFLETPVATEEGILDWKGLGWILDEQNLAIPANIQYFLPDMLQDEGRYHHHFVFEQGAMVSYDKKELSVEKVSQY